MNMLSYHVLGLFVLVISPPVSALFCLWQSPTCQNIIRRQRQHTDTGVVGCYHHGDYILFFFFFSLITYYAHLTHGSLAFWATNQHQLPRSTASLLTSSSSSPLLTSSQHHLSANAHNHIRTKNLNTKNTGKCGVVVVQEQKRPVLASRHLVVHFFDLRERCSHEWTNVHLRSWRH